MGTESRVVTELSEEHRDELNKLIVTPGWTLDKLMGWLEKHDYDIKRSSLHRYGANIKQAGEALRKTSEMTKALVQELGPKAAEGETGRVLVQFFQTMTMDFMLDQMAPAGEGEKKTPVKPMDLMLIAKSLNEATKALKSSADYEERIEARVQKAAAERVKEVIKGSKSKGITKETTDAIINGILGRA